jgi:NAD(P)-dependent dehydrogenase (short-subunit alcohol dehydrogenase family)
MNSMKGKRVIITGPTSGVGKEIALQLAELGAEIILACRDLKTGNQIASEITRHTGSSKLVVMQVDTSSQKSMREFAGEFRRRYRRLDVLINNAGGNRGTLPKVGSVDGIELTFATNVLGYFLLTQELLDVLKRSAPARIINVASSYASDLDLDDLQFERRPFESFRAYAQSKACDRMLTWALARRLKGSDVTADGPAHRARTPPSGSQVPLKWKASAANSSKTAKSLNASFGIRTPKKNFGAFVKDS